MRASVMIALSSLALSVLGGMSACEQTEHDANLILALTTTVTALEEGDWPVVWSYTDGESRERLLDLHEQLHAALEVVETTTEPALLEKARIALGRDLVADIAPGAKDAGPKLLSRILSPGDLRLDEHAVDGLRVSAVTFDGPLATVDTIAGERFTFTRTDAGWQSRLLGDVLDRHGTVESYLQNAATVTEHAASHQRAWRENTDPKQPQGAYNLLRQALQKTPVDGISVFAFLDDDARDALMDAIKRSRDVQRGIQKRVEPATRVVSYKRKKMWHHVRAGSDRQLYTYWAELPEYEPPFVTRAEPTRLERSPDETHTTVHTADGGTVKFLQASDGHWKLAGQSERLRKLLWEPMDRAYERMARPPEFWKYEH